MSINEFNEFLETAIRVEEEEQCRAQWTAMLPFMSLGMLKFVPFKQYYDQCTDRNIDMRSNEEIINEICEMHGIEVSEFGNI